MKRKYGLILAALEKWSGEVLFARDVSSTIAGMSNTGVTAKSIGRCMVWLEDMGFVDRQQLESRETAASRCRYTYLWVPPELRSKVVSLGLLVSDKVL